MATVKTLIGNIKGPKGDTGETGATGAAGAAASVDVGAVNTVSYTQPARVTNVGTPSNAIFNFDIPAGAPGSVGEISGYAVNAITSQPGDFPVPVVGDTIASVVGKQAKATADARDGISALNTQMSGFDTSIANILGDFASVEPTAYATKSYAVGDYLVLDGQFYKVIAAITIGNQLVVNGNIEATNVGAEISSLNNDLANKSPYPDYNNIVNVPPNTTYTCPEDGFIMPVRIFVATTGGSNLLINGQLLYGFSAGVEFGGSPFPVRAGDVVLSQRLETTSRILFLKNRIA